MEDDRFDNLKARAKTVYRRYGTLLKLPKAYPFAFWTETAQQTWREINAMPVEERTKLEADVKKPSEGTPSLRTRDNLKAGLEAIKSGVPADAAQVDTI